MIKEAYDAGVQQALFDIGLTKIAADPGVLAKAWQKMKAAPGAAAKWYGERGLPMQYGMAGLGGAGLGAGVGALTADDAGEGALRGAGIGLLGGLGARGGAALRDRLTQKGIMSAMNVNPGAATRGLRHVSDWAQLNPNLSAALGAGLGGAAGLGAGAGINALVD